MQKLRKELNKRGILHHGISTEVFGKAIGVGAVLVGIDNGFIIVACYSDVLDTVFNIYDRNYNYIASQNVYPDNQPSFGHYYNKWCSIVNDNERVWW